MPRDLLLLAPVLLAALATTGCGGDPAPPEGPTSSTGPTYYQDVKPILDAKCANCHTDGEIGPFTLTTYENAYAYRALIQQQVVDRVMPPWLAADGCADYVADRSLDEAQIALLSAWVDAGALEGDPAKEAPPLDTGPTYALSRVDLTLEMPVEYTALTEPDDYRCFPIDWPETTTTFVTGFRANPGKPQVVHHVIAFLVTDAGALDEVAALDAEDPAPGYTCFGGAGVRASWIGGWAPGGEGSDFPPGTGMRVEPGARVVLQVHYNSLTAGAMPDRTSIDVKLDAAVEKEALILPFTNPTWLGSSAMEIPAGEPDVVHSFAIDPTPFISGGQPFRIYSAGFHMHTLGTRGRVEIQRADGGTECMVDIPRWDFHWQGSYGFVEPKVFQPGDKISLECHWDNTAANQQMIDGVPMEPKDTYWGEGTTDEMCLSSFYVSDL